MAFFRQYIAPLFIFAIFLLALAAVSARIFLPSDMAMPAVMDEPEPAIQSALPGLITGEIISWGGSISGGGAAWRGSP